MRLTKEEKQKIKYIHQKFSKEIVIPFCERIELVPDMVSKENFDMLMDFEKESIQLTYEFNLREGITTEKIGVNNIQEITLRCKRRMGQMIKMQNKLKEEEARESMKFKDCNQDMIIGYVIETVPKRKKRR